MFMDEVIKYCSFFIIYIMILVASTNCIVEVLKDLFFLKPYPTKWVSTIISIAITLYSILLIFARHGLLITWYVIVAAIILGFFVAYGAMNGFDKLYGTYLDKIKETIVSLLVNKKGDK